MYGHVTVAPPLPSGDVMDVYDAAQRYREEATPLIILAGKDYGSGSSRDWAAKGPWILVSGWAWSVWEHV